MDYEKEISFGAFDSELMHQEIFIPEGFEATIDGDKIILTRKENEDERLRKLCESLVRTCFISDLCTKEERDECIAWLEKQEDKDKLIQELGEYKVKYTQEVLNEYLNISNKDNERLRKTTIDFLKEFADKGYENAIECIDWLEKQGEGKIADKAESMGHGYITTNSEFFQWIYDRLKYVYNENPNVDYMLSLKERIEDMQKSADKIEPKFKVGDWITDGYIHCKISDVLDDRYIVDTKFAKRSAIPFKRENDYHLWTIQDAKDGDVLVYHNTVTEIIMLFKSWVVDSVSAYTHFHIFDNSCRVNSSCDCGNGAHPATKEQRDLLFQRMKEFGYEWDFEKKELKKIEQKSADWSEEDEHRVEDAIYFLETAKKHYASTVELDACIDWLKNRVIPQPKQEWSEEDEEHIESILKRLDGMCKKGATFTETRFAVNQDMDWLKLLKDIRTWKPSDAQMEALGMATDIHSIPEKYYTELSKLYFDLKKLKGE